MVDVMDFLEVVKLSCFDVFEVPAESEPLSGASISGDAATTTSWGLLKVR